MATFLGSNILVILIKIMHMPIAVPTVGGVVVDVVVDDIAGFHISKFQNERSVAGDDSGP